MKNTLSLIICRLEVMQIKDFSKQEIIRCLNGCVMKTKLIDIALKNIDEIKRKYERH